MIEWQDAPGWLPPRRRVYVVGDVHGCAGKLRAVHRFVAGDLKGRPGVVPVLVHLGDYIDRGEDSAGVLDVLAGRAVCPTVNLKGNHEAALALALAEGGAAATDWLVGGGEATLRSWGADPKVREGWSERIPAAHRKVLEGLELWHEEGGYVFVHAGVRPGVALRRQAVGDLLGIREPFLSSAADHGHVVVHGHTPGFSVVVRENRIGIDTAAVFGGVLTCLVLEGERMGVFQV